MLRLIVSAVVVVLIQVLTAIGLLLQSLPRIMQVLWFVTVAFMALSCVGYRGLFGLVEGRWPGLPLTRQPWRTVASVGLSTVLVSGVCLVAGWDLSLPALAGAALHGLLVALAWDQLAVPNGQSLGW